MSAFRQTSEKCFQYFLGLFGGACFSGFTLPNGAFIYSQLLSQLFLGQSQLLPTGFHPNVRGQVRVDRVGIVTQKPKNSWQVTKLRVRSPRLPVQDAKGVHADDFGHVPLTKPPV